MLDGFQFDDDPPLDEKIRTEPVTEHQAVVFEWDRFVASNSESVALQSMGEDLVVNRLKKTRTERPMDLDGMLDSRAGNCIEGLHPTMC